MSTHNIIYVFIEKKIRKNMNSFSLKEALYLEPCHIYPNTGSVKSGPMKEISK